MCVCVCVCVCVCIKQFFHVKLCGQWRLLRVDIFLDPVLQRMGSAYLIYQKIKKNETLKR